MKKISQKRLDTIKRFLISRCPYTNKPTEINYACNGTPMTDKPGVEAREPCKYYRFKGTFKRGCRHPDYPKRRW